MENKIITVVAVIVTAVNCAMLANNIQAGRDARKQLDEVHRLEMSLLDRPQSFVMRPEIYIGKDNEPVKMRHATANVNYSD